MKRSFPGWLLSIVVLSWSPVGASAASAQSAEPVKLERYTVSETPFGYLGIKHASVVLSVFRLITFRGSVKYLQINELYPDSPGVQAGIKAGDRIVGLNGTPINRWTFRRLKEYGETVEIGQKVAVDILRPPETTPQRVEITVTKKPRPAAKP